MHVLSSICTQSKVHVRKFVLQKYLNKLEKKTSEKVVYLIWKSGVYIHNWYIHICEHIWNSYVFICTYEFTSSTRAIYVKIQWNSCFVCTWEYERIVTAHNTKYMGNVKKTHKTLYSNVKGQNKYKYMVKICLNN